MIARDRRLADRRHQDDEMGGEGRPVRLLVAGARRRSRVYRDRRTARGSRRYDLETGKRAVDAGARHDAEGAAGARRRQAVRRHRERQVLHRPPVGDRRGDPERSASCRSAQNSVQQADGMPEPILGRRRGLARPHLLRLERRALRDRVEDREEAHRLRRERAGADGRRRRRPTCRSCRPSWCSSPGQTVKLHARLFDAKGRFLREEKAATWALAGSERHGDRRQRSRSPPIQWSRPA